MHIKHTTLDKILNGGAATDVKRCCMDSVVPLGESVQNFYPSSPGNDVENKFYFCNHF